MDRLNAIVRFVLSLGNMSNVLHRNKKTGLCREKKISRPKNIFLPRINIKCRSLNIVRPVKCLNIFGL